MGAALLPPPAVLQFEKEGWAEITGYLTKVGAFNRAVRDSGASWSEPASPGTAEPELLHQLVVAGGVESMSRLALGAASGPTSTTFEISSLPGRS